MVKGEYYETAAEQTTTVASKQEETFDDAKNNAFQPQINAIRKAIFQEEKRLRSKYQWLKHQDQIGLGIFLGSLSLITLTCCMYVSGNLPVWLTIPIMAFLYSVMHELEHDTIHNLYFKDNDFLHNVFFAFIWLTKIGANPWWRRTFHLKHHKYSGEQYDVEERLIGLGLPLGLKKLLLTLTPLATTLVIFDVRADSFGVDPELYVFSGYLINLPVILPTHLIFAALFFPAYFSSAVYAFIWNYNMLCFLPNTLRQVCLQIVSTGVHYYGDIPSKNVYFQNQVLNHWFFYPLQAFCFNFGGTHIIHHYVTRQPFYLRQMCADAVLEEMKKQGVRFNDLDIFARSHRYNKQEIKSE